MNAERLRHYEYIADALAGLDMMELSTDEKASRKLKAQVRDDLRAEYEQLRREDAAEEAAAEAV